MREARIGGKCNERLSNKVYKRDSGDVDVCRVNLQCQCVVKSGSFEQAKLSASDVLSLFPLFGSIPATLTLHFGSDFPNNETSLFFLVVIRLMTRFDNTSTASPGQCQQIDRKSSRAMSTSKVSLIGHLKDSLRARHVSD